METLCSSCLALVLQNSFYLSKWEREKIIQHVKFSSNQNDFFMFSKLAIRNFSGKLECILLQVILDKWDLLLLLII